MERIMNLGKFLDLKRLISRIYAIISGGITKSYNKTKVIYRIYQCLFYSLSINVNE